MVKKISLLFLFLIFGSIQNICFSQEGDQGEELFRTKCKMCHALNVRLIGPALEGVNERHDINWIYDFVNGSQSMIAEGDSKSVELFNEYNQVIMPDQELTTDQIDAILAYVKTEELARKEQKEEPAEEVVATSKPLSTGYFYTLWGFLILGTVAILIGMFCLKELYTSLELKRIEFAKSKKGN
jgi:cytochrome c2